MKTLKLSGRVCVRACSGEVTVRQCIYSLFPLNHLTVNEFN